MTDTMADPRRWKALAVLGIAYLMVVLDVSIVNVALPSIQTDLGFSTEDLQWVVSGYALTFGGFLLLGGRMGDLLGRRRVFMAGLALFLVTSLLAGLSTSSEMLIVARLLQGAAGAILSPSVFSITLVTFAEGAERNKALGILGGIAGSGAAIGVLLGGVFTEYVGWQWIFFVNIPIAALALALVPRYVRESRADGLARHFDTIGAVTVTASLMLLVFGLTQGNRVGWDSAQTILVFTASAILMAFFLWNESRSRSPLVRLGIFRKRTLTGREPGRARPGDDHLRDLLPALALHAAGARLLGDGDRRRLPGRRADRHRRGHDLAGARHAPRRQAGARGGHEPARPSGCSSSPRCRRTAPTGRDLFPGFLIIGVGMGFSFVPISIAALAGVQGPEAGLASGLINTSQQIGGALGLAVLTTIATTHTTTLLDEARRRRRRSPPASAGASMPPPASRSPR